MPSGARAARAAIAAYNRTTVDAAIVVDPLLERLTAGALHDPLALLGAHPLPDAPGGWVIRVYDPRAHAAWVETNEGWQSATPRGGTGVFELCVAARPARPWRVRFERPDGVHQGVDPYAFPPSISDHDRFLFNAGRLHRAYRTLGAQPMTCDGVAGTRFAAWAPNANAVSVVGDFNGWDGRVHPLVARTGSGLWELFVPGVEAGALYKFEIRSRANDVVMLKTDPYAQAFEMRPGTAARVVAPSAYAWGDAEWCAARNEWDWLHAPISVYEVHAGSWRRHSDGRPYSYRELAASLVSYVRDLGYTHIEFLPLTEHPLDESWGYQTIGYFAPTSRYGTPDDLRHLIDTCHRAGVGVILDWVPGHFPRDASALASFDGTALYEHADPRQGVQPEWGTHVFNYGRHEVRTFLLASADYWLREFHFDGLRVDAVASMLYLDYARAPGAWMPNPLGGRENLEAMEFLRELNIALHREFPGALVIAEESTAWPMVSRPAHLGGLGFSIKWNLGWMHDTLRYLARDPVHRRHHQDDLTFGRLYAFTENFVLPLSHDEVVHGKGSLLARMPGDDWQRFANLRLLFAWQTGWPGKKLSFMGNEFGQSAEWNAGAELAWKAADGPLQAGLCRLVRDLNRLYRQLRPMHELDFDAAGFEWVDCHDANQSVLAFLRHARNGAALVIFNFTPVVRERYRVGVRSNADFREVCNTDSGYYGGSNVGNAGRLRASAIPAMGLPYSVELTLPPLGALFLVPDGR
jgi:1,4-alpha-glucan branching enzyme